MIFLASIISLILMASPGEGAGFAAFVPLILIVIVIYFLFIRPNLKKKKKAVKETPVEKDITPEINDRNFCSNCGKDIKMNAKFCGYCGNNLL